MRQNQWIRVFAAGCALLLILAGCSAQAVPAGTQPDYQVPFADQALEYVIREHLGVADGDPVMHSDLDIFKLLTIAPGYIELNNTDVYALPDGLEPTTLRDLPHFQHLGWFLSTGIPWESLESLGECGALQKVMLSKVDTLTDLDFLTGLDRLVVLGVYNNHYLRDFSALGELTSLVELDLHNTGFRDISLLQGLTKLKTLSLHNNRIESLEGMENLTSLTELDLRGNVIADVAPLSGLGNLTKLRLDVNRITDPSPLSGLEKLNYLNLDYNQLESLDGLDNLPKLNLLRVRHNPGLSAAGVSALRERLREDCVVEWA